MDISCSGVNTPLGFLPSVVILLSPAGNIFLTLTSTWSLNVLYGMPNSFAVDRIDFPICSTVFSAVSNTIAFVLPTSVLHSRISSPEVIQNYINIIWLQFRHYNFWFTYNYDLQCRITLLSLHLGGEWLPTMHDGKRQLLAAKLNMTW